MLTLGITAFHGPSAVCLVRDGRVIAAVREDRLSRRPLDARFPAESVAYCLRAGKIGATSLDAIAVSGSDAVPPTAAGSLEGADLASSSWHRPWTRLFRKRPRLADWIAREIDPSVPVRFVERARAHAWAALAESPFEAATIAVWEPGLACVARSRGGRIESCDIRAVEGSAIRFVSDVAAEVRAASPADPIVVTGSSIRGADVAAALRDTAAPAPWWIHPACGGGADAIGAAWCVAAESDAMEAGGGRTSAGVGPGYNRHQIRTLLRSRGVVPTEIERDEAPERAAQALAEGSRVGWFQGRMDFSDDTLISRSIVSMPAPGAAGFLLVARERADHVIDLGDRWHAPFAWGVPRAEWRDRFGLDASPCPVYAVERERARAMHRLLDLVAEKTGAPFLISEALCTDDTPSACTPGDAYDASLARGLDLLLMENCAVGAAVLAAKTASP